MEQDMLDVFIRHTKSLSSFSEEYQGRLKAAYQFSATRFNSSENAKVNRTSDTLDII
jgi:hypothetical protein